MGSGAGKVSSEEVARIQRDTKLVSDEIEKLRNKFDYLKTKQGRGEASLIVNARDIRLLSEFCLNPLIERLLDVILETMQKEEVDFDGFVKVMSFFSPNTNLDEKRKMTFRALDFDSDGFLSFHDLFKLYSKYIFSLKHPSEQRQEAGGRGSASEEFSCLYSKETLTSIINKIIQDYDEDRDGKLSFREFLSACTEWDLRELVDIYFV